MNRIVLLLFMLLVTVGVMGCASGNSFTALNSSSKFEKECRNASNELFAIEAYEGKAVSVCPVGGEQDCLYSRQAGRTFQYATPDLNSDGRLDAVIKDFTGAYGSHEVIHFMAFAQCGDGSYIKVVDDMLQDVGLVAAGAKGQWADLDVTRGCYSELLGQNQIRHFRLKFDELKYKYGPPTAFR